MKKIIVTLLCVATAAVLASCNAPQAPQVVSVDSVSGDSIASDITPLSNEIQQVDAIKIDAVSSASMMPSTPKQRTLVNAQQINGYISAEKAKEVALKHAGVSASAATFLRSKLDYDDGRAKYDIEFYSNQIEYDYEISAVNGEILEFDRDIEYYNYTPATPGAKITAEKAKEIAFKHAGVSAASVSFVRSELDYDDGRAKYDIEFYSNNTEYDYEISAATGEVLSYDRDIENYSYVPAAQGMQITAERAKEIALKHAGVSAAAATFVRSKLDYDNGIAKYDVEFYSNNTEYDYEIAAANGEILSFDRDIEYYTNTPSAPGTQISVEKAKQIALNHAGVSASSATFIKSRLDYDDGRAKYDVEFYSGNAKYDYEIAASNGNIISYDQEGSNRAPSTSSSATSNIGTEKAKSIALNHAGVSASAAGFIKCEFDYDDGAAVYEVEFRSGGIEYDYKIGATTGAVISYDRDLDD